MNKNRIIIISFLIIASTAIFLIPTKSALQDGSGNGEETLIAGRNVNMVSGTTLPDGDPWLQRQNEPSLAVSTRNPLHLLAGANDYRTVDMPIPGEELPGKEEQMAATAGDAWLGVFMSYDGGQSWKSTLLPGYKQYPGYHPLKNFSTAADPVVRSGPSGLFYYCGIAFNRGTNKGVVFVSRFIDNNDQESGDTIHYVDTTIIASGNADTFLDKPWIAVDKPRFPGTVRIIDGQRVPRHNVYIAFSRFSGEGADLQGDIMFARSRNCGNSWKDPYKISRGNFSHQGATIAIRPTLGTVFVVWRRFGLSDPSQNKIFVAKSLSRGLNFQRPKLVASLPPFDQPSTDELTALPGTAAGPSFRTNSYPSIAADDSGRVYVAWAQRYMGPDGDARVVLSTSYTGNNWSAPQAISELDEYGLTFQGHQFMPSISCAAGKITAVWYDQRYDFAAGQYGYNNWILDDLSYRHTIDVWAAQADLDSYPTLDWKYTQVSRYLYSLLRDELGEIVYHEGKPVIFQSQFNCPNYPLFQGGHLPFDGDYIDLSPSPAFVLDGNAHWQFNMEPSDSPLFHVAWTDNRDVRPPSNGNWTVYAPPDSAQDPDYISGPGRPWCTTGGNTPGMRNQNIYTSQLTQGIEAGSPTNHKPLDLSVPRAFVVFVKNNTEFMRSFRLSIAGQPPGGQASFLQFELLESLEVYIAPFSTISRPVFIQSTDPDAAVSININEIDANGAIIPGGLNSIVILNGDPSNPDVFGDNIENQEIHNPNIVNPTAPNIVNWFVNPNIVNPNIVNPNIVNPNIVNPNIVNPNIVNPNIVNPNIVNPNIVNPNIVNPNIVNPNIVNPNIVNPNIVNAGLGDIAITDVEWILTNDGNATTSYTLKALAKKSPPPGVYAQLLVYRVHYTPAVAGKELSDARSDIISCELKQEPHHELILNITNPNIVNPNIVNPNIVNPNIVNSSIENATFPVKPDEEIRVTLRVLDTSGLSGSGMMAAQGTASIQAADTQEFIDSLGFAVAAQAVDSDDAAAGITEVKTDATALVIQTASLPDGFAHQNYTAQLRAAGGTPALSWNLTDGELPPGLALSTSGSISGIPTSVGTYGFNVEVTDSGSPAQKDTQKYSITIYAGTTPDPMAITSTSPLPSGVLNTWYGFNLQATGGAWPRSWSLLSGSLPPGLSLDSGGLISGTPTATGTYSFTVRVTDDDGQYVDGSFSLNISSNTATYVTISGFVYDKNGIALDGVTMRGLPNTPITGEGGTPGSYSDTVPQGWSGTVEPFRADFAFTPQNRTYSELQDDATSEHYNQLAVATQQWVARYDSGQAGAMDRITAMTTDGAGNIYVTGFSGGSGTLDDVAVVKYNSSGTQQWAARYNSPGNYSDIPYDIAVDASGNVVVTGYTNDALELHNNYLTIKFDSSGTQQWVATWTGPTRNNDIASAVALDTNGNVYITGYSDTPGYNYDYVTIKYNSTGQQQWLARYDGPDFDRASDIAVDDSGNVYVTGETFEETTGRDFATIKYDSDGEQQWIRRHNGYNNSWDRYTSLVLDDSGNIYVTGQSEGNAGSLDIATIKYNSAGDQIGSTAWYDNEGSTDRPVAMIFEAGSIYIVGDSAADYVVVRYDTSLTETMSTSYDSGALDRARDIGVDSSGNVYVTGYSQNGNYYEFCTVKFDAAGVWDWTVREDGAGNGDEVPAALVVNPSDNIIVAGRSHGDSSDDDFVTIQYDTAGSENWDRTYRSTSNDEATGWYNKFLALDGTVDENIYIAGTSMGAGTSYDFTAVKYDRNGNFLWEARANGPGNYIDTAEAMTVDIAGNVYVVGSTRDGRNADIMTVKFDSAGGTAWVRTYDGTANDYDWGYAITTDGSGNVYVTGMSTVSGQALDVTTIMYNSTGGQVWVSTYDGPDHSDDEGYGIAVDGSGNVYVTGESYGNTTHYDIVTVKYNSLGIEQWDVRYGGSDSAMDTAYFVTPDSTGSYVYVCGDSQSGNGSDYTIIKYAAYDGSQIGSVARYDGGAGGLDWPLALVLDSNDNVYVTGMSEGMGTFRDFATLKYDSDLNLQWEARYDAPLHSYDYGRELAVDSAGNVYVAGRTAETNRHADITTIKYNSAGDQVWIIKHNGPENESYDGGSGIALDASGNIFVGGLSSGIGTGFDFVVIKYLQ